MRRWWQPQPSTRSTSAGETEAAQRAGSQLAAAAAASRTAVHST